LSFIEEDKVKNKGKTFGVSRNVKPKIISKKEK
jgi:hypothetical protein